MLRQPIVPRENWQQKVEQWGLVFHTEPGQVYWNESACYQFTSAEIEVIESATRELHQMCLQAVEHTIHTKQYERFNIPPHVIPRIEESWELEPPTLYGRFDLVYDGHHPPKMLEYNADTPTSLLEAAVIQWKWLDDLHPERDQFNLIWEGLVNQWKWLIENQKLLSNKVHFGFSDLVEDEMTIAVLRDTAHEAGLLTDALLMEQVGWNDKSKVFVDLNDQPILNFFKLYPWEWIVSEEFGHLALANLHRTQWIEPVWKMLLSNKALLATLYELYPNSPYLLPSFLDGPREMQRYVKKPLLGREGANVTIVADEFSIEQDGDYGSEGFVYQEFIEIPNFDGNHPVIGSWVVGEDPVGIGIRETDGLITDNLARFVPHWFV
jgi:glutathionylspermidine synthase